MYAKAPLPIILLLSAAPTAAQTHSFSYYGESAGAAFGDVVELIGDVDGDGEDDVAVGAPFSDETVLVGSIPVFVEDAGSVSVYSGATGDLLWKQAGPLAGDTEFGHAISDAGDVDGDGHDDILVGLPTANGLAPSSGAVQLLSGLDGSLLRTFFGSQTDERYGSALCAGHMDLDLSSAEAAIGAPDHDDDDNLGGFGQEGRVEIVELATGDVLTELEGGSVFLLEPEGTIDEWVRRSWGAQVEYIGDYDGDGYGGVAVSAPFTDYIDKYLFFTTIELTDIYVNAGFVQTIEPLDPLPPFGTKTWVRGAAGSLFGTCLQAFRTDMDEDGFIDWAAYGSGDRDLVIYSGFFDTVVYTDHPWLEGVTSIAYAGDVNENGWDDFVVGIPGVGSEPGKVYVVDGQHGTPYETYHGPAAGSRFGQAVTCNDMNGDGLPEIWVGTPSDDSAFSNAGAVYVEGESTCFSPASWQNYGAGTPGTLGIPFLVPLSEPRLGELMTVDMANAGSEPALCALMIGVQQLEFPLFGGTGLLVPAIVEVFTLGAPFGSLTFSIPDAPGLCGAVVYMQTLQENSGGPQGFALSPGLKLTLGS